VKSLFAFGSSLVQRKEVVEKFQMTEEKVSDRAAYLRRHGVQLKKFVKGEQLDYKKLNELAKSLAR